MLLTKKYLKEYQESMFVYIPENLKRQLLNDLGHMSEDEEGHLRDFTEQDLSEQVRKAIQEYGEKPVHLI